MLRVGFDQLTPQWFKTMFLGLPAAGVLRFGEKAERMTLPRTVLTTSTKGDQPRRTRVVDALLPTEFLLCRTIDAPPDSRGSHWMIAELDLQRRTPFTPDDVHWTLDTASAGKTGHMTQWIAKRSDVTHFRTLLRSHGYQVRRFLVEGTPNQAVLADFTSQIAPRFGGGSTRQPWLRSLDLRVLFGWRPRGRRKATCKPAKPPTRTYATKL